MRRALDLARGDAPDLVELGHQVDARVQPAGGVDEHDVAAARLAGGDRVEDDGRRDPRPGRARMKSTPARVAQISSCSTAAARNVSAAQMSGVWPPSLMSRASLPTVVVLPCR